VKFKIVRSISADELPTHVRREFVARLPPRLESERFTLILFRFQRDRKQSGVILSSVVKQAIARLGSFEGERALAFGGDFTQEARAVLEANGIVPISLGDFHWTDESYKQIKGQS
jgi:hypothetical protein